MSAGTYVPRCVDAMPSPEKERRIRWNELRLAHGFAQEQVNAIAASLSIHLPPADLKRELEQLSKAVAALELAKEALATF